MKLVIVAVGQRQPDWAQTACDDYVKRFPPECRLEIKPVKTEPRTAGKPVDVMMAAERKRIEAAIPKGARLVVLDERGDRRTSTQLAARLTEWMNDGRDVALVIGGPDGLDAEFKAGAQETLRLSDLTLPHAMVRVILTEALYRAWSVMVGHPYHRE